MPWKCQESCIRTQCFTKNVLDIVSTRLCFIHELWERVGMNSPHTNSHPQSPHFRFEKQIETGQTWCFCTKKKIDWAEATAKAYKWRLWNTGFWLAESIWSQPMALALRFAANPFKNIILYRIYHANNWGRNIILRVSVRPYGRRDWKYTISKI